MLDLGMLLSDVTWIHPVFTPLCSRRPYLCQHSSCGQQAAVPSARGAGGHPEDGLLFSKPQDSQLWQEIRGRQTEANTVRKSLNSQWTSFLKMDIYHIRCHSYSSCKIPLDGRWCMLFTDRNLKMFFFPLFFGSVWQLIFDLWPVVALYGKQ